MAELCHSFTGRASRQAAERLWSGVDWKAVHAADQWRQSYHGDGHVTCLLCCRWRQKQTRFILRRAHTCLQNSSIFLLRTSTYVCIIDRFLQWDQKTNLLERLSGEMSQTVTLHTSLDIYSLRQIKPIKIFCTETLQIVLCCVKQAALLRLLPYANFSEHQTDRPYVMCIM